MNPYIRPKAHWSKLPKDKNSSAFYVGSSVAYNNCTRGATTNLVSSGSFTSVLFNFDQPGAYGQDCRLCPVGDTEF